MKSWNGSARAGAARKDAWRKVVRVVIAVMLGGFALPAFAQVQRTFVTVSYTHLTLPTILLV